MALHLLPLNTMERIRVSFPVVDVQGDSILILELMAQEDSSPAVLEQHCGIAKHLLKLKETLNSMHIPEAAGEDIQEAAN